MTPSNVVSLHSTQETVAEFVAREKCVSTASVANRFGLYEKDARRALRALERAGVLRSERQPIVYAGGNGTVALVWMPVA